MSNQIWSDVAVEVQGAAAAPRVIDTISKTNPAVAGSVIHGYQPGEIVLLRIRGFSELDYAVVRVGAVTPETFVLLGIDGTDLSGSFALGTASKLTIDVSAETITDVTPIFVHNHPSGSAEPSRADEMLTQTLKSALSLVDVRVIDHIIVAGCSALSMAERGLL